MCKSKLKCLYFGFPSPNHIEILDFSLLGNVTLIYLKKNSQEAPDVFYNPIKDTRDIKNLVTLKMRLEL